MHILATARARSSARCLTPLGINGPPTSTRSLVRLFDSKSGPKPAPYTHRSDLQSDRPEPIIDGELAGENAPFENEDDLANFAESLSQIVEGSPPQPGVISQLKPRELPRSPLLSNDFLDVSKAVRSIKLKPNAATLTPFQKKLRHNPFALAISSPVRICQFTRTAVPNYFLLRFKLTQDPRRPMIFYVPDSPLLKRVGELRKLDLSAEEADLEVDTGATFSQSSLEPPNARKRTSIGAGAYVPARRIALCALNDPSAGLGKHPRSTLIPTRDFKSPGAMKQHNNAWLAPNVHDQVLKLLRTRARMDILRAVHLQRGYVSGFGSWEEAMKYSSQAGSFLWVKGGERPPEFATILLQPGENSTPRKVPVHNLEILLGKDGIEMLKAEAVIFNRPVLAVKNRNVTVQLELQLWALQCYLAEHKTFIDAE